MNRIEKRLQERREEGKKVFITYMTAGLPDMEGTKEIIRAQTEAGIDIIELGIPFSDPAADGPVIQNASYRSIKKGTNLRRCFSMIEELRKGCDTPIVFMMYYNTILHYGLKDFAEKCASVGVDGLIIPDLPYEEQRPLKDALDQIEDAPILIQLISPVSKDRIPMILKGARGFVYCVSAMGVTGQEATFYNGVSDYLKTVKKLSPVPVMMGFGIRTAEDVGKVKEWIDGAIVGSHFMTLMEESGYNRDKIKKYIQTFQAELNGN